MRRKHLSYLLIGLSVLTAQAAMASRQQDSAHTAVEGNSSDRERAQALMVIAGRQMRTAPGEALRRTLTAAHLAEKLGDQALLLRALRQQRDIEALAGAYDQFLATAIRVADISQRGNDPKALANDLRSVCEGYERVGNHTKAIEMRRQALFLLRGTGDSMAIGQGIVDLINSLVIAGRFSEVIDQSEEALAYYRAHDDTVGQANVWLRHGEALLSQERFADALPILHRAERVFREADTAEELSRTLRGLCSANIGLHRWREAAAQLEESGKLNDGRVLPESILLASHVYEGLGDPSAALAFQRRYTELSDSLFSARMAERIIGLQAFYGAQRADQVNAELKARMEEGQVLVQNAETRGRWWLAASIALAAVIASAAIVLRHMRKLTRRAHVKQALAARQAETIKAKNLELERQNLRLAEALANEDHKDTQLKEIHHRVKNNLQIVNTLLKMQGDHLADNRLQRVLMDCQGRVRSMALVHEHIYRCGDLHQVNVKAHVLALGDAILKHHELHDRVRLDLNVGYDHAELDTLIPLSLLLNELITNSAKHAFLPGTTGTITIVLRRLGEEQCELVYSDDGVGLGQHDFFHTASFGLELVRTLAAQLDGKIRLLKGEGTTFQLSFQPQQQGLRKAS